MKQFLRASETDLGSFIRSANKFTLPKNQRNYEWTKKERNAFWLDIWNVVSNDCPFYFLGTFVLDASGEYPTIIDGQQRMTTASILVAALRNMLLDAEQKEKAETLENDFLFLPGAPKTIENARLSLNAIDEEFFFQHILSYVPYDELKAIYSNSSLPESNKHIAEGLGEMIRSLQNAIKSSGKSLEQLTDEISVILNQRVGLIRIEVESDLNAFTVFETLNDRGRYLNSADLLKNHLIHIADTGSPKAVKDWDSMSTNLAQVDQVDFIMHHWNSTRKHIEKRNIYKDIKSALVTQKDVIDFCESLAVESDHYSALFDMCNPRWKSFDPNEREEITNWLEFIRLIGTKPQYIVLLAVLVENEKSIGEFLNMLANFTFRYGKVCNNPPSKVEAVFAQAALKMRARPNTTAHELFDEFFAQLYPSDEDFIEAFTIHKKREAGLSRYVLSAINDHLLGSKGFTAEKSGFTSLEHILPINYEQEWGKWPTGFPDGAEAYIWRLGNLTLLPPEVNGELGNANFATKKELYKQHDLDITKSVLNFDNWTAESIEQRQNAMAQIAAQIWRYPN